MVVYGILWYGMVWYGMVWYVASESLDKGSNKQPWTYFQFGVHNHTYAFIATQGMSHMKQASLTSETLEYCECRHFRAVHIFA